MPSAEIIAIGTELLLGEIQDTNTRHVAVALRNLGVDLFRTSIVGDNPGRIAEAVQHALQRAEMVITTGGLGPTIDDVTREGVAQALGVPIEYRSDLWEQILERYRSYGREPTENNRRQAQIPVGGIAIRNPVGTAPAFIVEDEGRAVICLPGVPREMVFLMEHEVLPYLRRRFDLHEVIAVRLLHTSGVGESQIDARLSDLETQDNPTVGLAAHTGQVDVRITAKAGTAQAARALIEPVEAEIHRRLGDWVFGVDEQTLEQVALGNLSERGWSLVVLEAGLGCALASRLGGQPPVFTRAVIQPAPLPPDRLREGVLELQSGQGAQVGLGVTRHPGANRQVLHFILSSPQGERSLERSYGGPPENAPLWAANIALHLLRKL